jgi:hypothetical protein
MFVHAKSLANWLETNGKARCAEPYLSWLVAIRKAPFLDSRLRGNDEPEPIRRGEVHTGK